MVFGLSVQSSASSDEGELRRVWNSLLENSILLNETSYVKDEEECAINMVLQVILSKYKGLLKVVTRREEETKLMRSKLEDADKKYQDLYNRSLQKEKCSECCKYERNLKSERDKFKALEIRMKKCASMINSLIDCKDDDAGVLGQVHALATQAILGEDLEHPGKTAAQSLKRKKVVKLFNCSPKHSSEDDELIDVLVPGTPEKVLSTQDQCAYFDGTVCVPETAPFDLEHSPIAKVAPAQLESRFSFSPAAGKGLSELNESIFYSPPVFKNNTRKVVENGATTSDSEDFKESKPKKKLFSDLKLSAVAKLPSSGFKIRDHFASAEREKRLKSPSPNRLPKRLKQTKLTTSDHAGPSAVSVREFANNFKEPSTKEVPPWKPGLASTSPNKEIMFDTRKKKRGKGPENWTCNECRQIFLGSNIDTRKLKPSMNFCPEHRNRYTYYMDTPPNFWNLQMINSPRKGGDDFIVDSHKSADQ